MDVIGRRMIRSRASRARRIDAWFSYGVRTFLVGALLYGNLAWVAMQPWMQVEAITVEGTRAIDPVLIEGIVRDHLKESLLPALSYESVVFVPNERIARSIRAQYPRAQAVTVVTAEQTIRVVISEYVPSYLWCGEGEQTSAVSATGTDSEEIDSTDGARSEECLLADEKGYLFAAAAYYAGDPFIRFHTAPTGSERAAIADLSRSDRLIGAMVLSSDEFAKVAAFVELLETHSGLTPKRIITREKGDYEIVTERSWHILWASDLDPADSADRLARALVAIEAGNDSDEPVRVIDLRFGNKIFYQ